MINPPLILVADDDPMHRLLMKRILTKWGYEVLLAEDGNEAWELLRQRDVGIVVTDWMMPGMDGIELCKKIRDGEFSSYIYIILLTSRMEREDLLFGLEAGADDFVGKPFYPAELRARVRNGHRIHSLEHDLRKKNRELEDSYNSLQRVHDRLTGDLQAAAWLQQRLLPPTPDSLQGFRFDALFIPCHFVAGDIFHFFPVSDEHIAFFLVDVSGHGVASAMLSISISKIITSAPLMESFRGVSLQAGMSTVAAMQALNRVFASNNETMGKYFTMVLGTLEKSTGLCRFTLAGHPHPLFIPAGGEPEFVGESGSPIGLLSDVYFEETSLHLAPGDRMLLYSDGITDCTSPAGEPFGPGRLMEAVCDREKPLEEIMKGSGLDLFRFHGSDRFEDDVSLLIFERMK